MIEPDLFEMLESEVTFEEATGRALDGGRSFGAPTTGKCHVEYKRQMVRNANGEEVMASGRCLLDTVYPAVTEQTRLTMPNGDQPPIVAIETTYDTEGPYQTVVYF